jgi:hypothetical protein
MIGLFRILFIPIIVFLIILIIKTKKNVIEKKELKMEQKDKKRFISPSGAGIVLICFFLPWVKFSCAGNTTYASGADLGGPMWIIFAASIIILGSFFYFKNVRKLEQSKPIVLISSIISLVIIIYKYIDFAGGMKTEFGTVTPSSIGLSLQFGGIFTIIGLLLSLIGTSFLTQENNDEGDIRVINIKEETLFCPNCGAKIETSVKFCPECGNEV